MSKPIASSPRLRAKPAAAAPAPEVKPAKPALKPKAAAEVPAAAPAKLPEVAAPKAPASAPKAATVKAPEPVKAPAAKVAPPAAVAPAPEVVAPAIEAAPPAPSIPVAEAPAPIAADTAVLPATPTPSPAAKEVPMTETIDLSPAKSAFYDLQAKAKAGLEKSQAMMAEASEFAKGNLEAAVESSKIAAASVQELTGSFIAESKATFETLSAEVKELASAKSPTEFFKLHSDLTLKHFDNAVAYSSKHSEKLMKLATEITAPLTARVSLAMEKLQKAA